MDFDLLKGKFNISECQRLNPLVLALVGDAIYEVFIRAYLVDLNRNVKAHKLHTLAIRYVKAQAQSNFIKRIEPMLSEDEILIFKRGRNAKSGTIPKNADVQEYHNATGFEALVGFLYLTEQKERLNELFLEITKICENGIWTE